MVHRNAAFIIALAMILPLWSVAASAADVIYEGGFDLGDLEWVDRADGSVVPVLAQTRTLDDTDMPALTGRSLTLLVPVDESIGAVEIVPLSTVSLNAPAPLALAEQQVSSEGIAAVQVIHGSPDDKVFPAAWGRMGGTHVMRGYRLLTVTVYPLRARRAVDGTWRDLEFLESYAVRILPDVAPVNPDEIAVRQRKVPGERARLERILEPLVDNPETLPGYRREDGVEVVSSDKGFAPTKSPSLSGSPVSYLIITSEEFAEAFQPLADHRTAQGLPAVVKTIEWVEANYRHGVDLQETIRSFIRDAYERWGVEYVLMGGDTGIVPARFIQSEFYPYGGSTLIPADIYFSALDGNWNADGDAEFGEPMVAPSNPGDDCDMASDIGYGRAPVNSVSEVQTFVSKVITQELHAAGAEFANRIMFAAEVLFYDTAGEINQDGADYAVNLIENVVEPCTDMEYIQLYESYDRLDGEEQLMYPGSIRETRRAVLDSLDTGRYGIFNQIGHGFLFEMSVGDNSITAGDCDLLTNENTFLMYGLNCASAAFDYNCLMERLVRNPNGGSYASIGASRAAFPATANDFQVEFFEQLMCGGEDRLGDLIALSRLPWLDLASAEGFTRWSYMNYTLLGDPAQKVMCASPAAVDITAPAGLTVGEQSVTLTVTAGGSAVEGAHVTLSGSDIYVTDVSDEFGQVDLPLVLTAAGDLTLTVCGANLEQTDLIIPVTNPGAYIALDEMTVIDDGSHGSSGNGNGRMEAGETVALLATFVDTGSGGGSGLSAELTTSSAGVTVIDDDVDVPDISSGGSQAASEYFVVEFDHMVYDGFRLEFRIEATDGSSSWVSEWTATLTAPEVESFSLDWYDSFYGDGDGVVDDNERIALRMGVKNYGAGRCDVLTGRLRSDSPNVTLLDSVVIYSDIELMDTSFGDAIFSLRIVDASEAYDLRIDFEDDKGRTFSHDVQVVDPSAPSGLDFATTLGSDVIELVWDPVEEEDVVGYNVYRSYTETGGYARINVDLVEGTSYFRDDGLDLLTRYYYKISAVNVSLIEGDLSDPANKSTAPPEVGNFPLPFGRETDSHCAVGDVTGDGNLEVVLAADEVYIWKSDGSELFDGDDDSQTLGPITDHNGRFTAMAVTLAELDGEPGLEIICSDRDEKLIYIYKSDGTLLPGWPKSTVSHWVWAPAAVGDIDGDGEPEIVCNNLDKCTLAWNVDGTEVSDGDSNPSTDGVLIDRDADIPWASWNRSGPALFDLDHDGAKDIIFGTRYGWEAMNSLRAYRWDGTTLPGFPIETALGGDIMVSPTVADLNDDGVWEIIFVSEDDYLHVVEEDGTYYSGFPISFTANSRNGDRTCPSPAVGDFDDDGELEIAAVAVHNYLSSYMWVIDTDIAGGTSGQALPGWPVFMEGNSNGSVVVGDIDGDGHLDCMLGIGGGNTESPNNLYAFTYDGQDVAGFPLTLGGPVNPTPVICDLDDDHDVDIVYGGWDLFIHVWDMPATFDGTKMPWTTFRGSSCRDGVFRVLSTTDVPSVTEIAKLTLEPNHPNPFNPSTSVKLYVPGESASDLRVDIFDVQGRRVRSLFSGEVAPGWHTVTWQGRDDMGRPQASGIYFMRAEAGGDRSTLKMSLVK